MHLTVEVPEDLAHILGKDNPQGLTRVGLESSALEGLRSGELTVGQARRLLGISSRYEMDGFLKLHDVMFGHLPGN